MPPAPGHTDPSSLRSRLREWFDAHPGLHRCQDVAADLKETTWSVANECGRLRREGLLARQQVSVEGRKTPVTYYSAVSEGRRRAPNRRKNERPTRHEEGREQEDRSEA